MKPGLARVIAGVLALCSVTAACGGGAGGEEPGGGTLDVFAAASLTGAFDDIAARFEADHPDITVRLNFLSSSDLAGQIEQGAPADVFASADEASMDRLTEAGLTASEPRDFAHNRLEIVVRPGNPKGIESLGDLTDDSLVLSLCNEACPAGRYAQEALRSAGLDVHPDSLEADVKGVVSRVTLGEADAGICYATDVRAAGNDVEGVAIPPRENVTATYPIATLKGASEEAGAFVDLVLSTEGQSILEAYGFQG